MPHKDWHKRQQAGDLKVLAAFERADKSLRKLLEQEYLDVSDGRMIEEQLRQLLAAKVRYIPAGEALGRGAGSSASLMQAVADVCCPSCEHGDHEVPGVTDCSCPCHNLTGASVQHVDGDPRNNALSNLTVVMHRSNCTVKR